MHRRPVRYFDGNLCVGDELEAYKVLVKVYTAVGWDRLLDIRSEVGTVPIAACLLNTSLRVQVFVMQEDVDGEPDGEMHISATPCVLIIWFAQVWTRRSSTRMMIVLSVPRQVMG